MEKGSKRSRRNQNPGGAYCFVPGCRNSFYYRNPEVSFHRIPISNNRDHWLAAIRRAEEEACSVQHVCSEHFCKDDFWRGGARKLLKSHAVPTVKLPPADTQPEHHEQTECSSDAIMPSPTNIMPFSLPTPSNWSLGSGSTISSSVRDMIKAIVLDHPYSIQINKEHWPPKHHEMLDPLEIVHPYNCSQCSHRTASSFQLDHHVQRNHKNVYAAELFHAIVEPQQFLCVCCDYKSYHQFELYEHCKQAHNPSTEDKENTSFCGKLVEYPCDHCMYKFNSSLCLVRHHDLCTDGSPTFSRDSVVESVEWLELNNADARIFDNDGATELNNMSTRNSVSGKIRLCKCNSCMYRAERKIYLEGDMLRHGTNEGIRWFQCNNCSHRSKRNSHSKKHMLQHAKNEDIDWFRCNNCSYRAKRNFSLRKHMLEKHATNEEITWFQCNHCPHRSKRKGASKKHMLHHSATEDIT